MNDFCVCILAHNEQKHIAATIEAITTDCTQLSCDIKVYANGCTDGTVGIVKSLAKRIPNLSLRELVMASKTNAWNVAFQENAHAILIFSDGDVTPEMGAIKALWLLLTEEQPEIILAGCSFWPRKSGLTLGQRLVGLSQIPLCQNFLSGQLYAVRRNELDQELRKTGISGMPLGVVAEDMFLEQLVQPDKFLIIDYKVFYEPPNLSDYYKYLARMRWQEEQLVKMYGNIFGAKTFFSWRKITGLMEKKAFSQGIQRLLLGIVTTGLRCTLKILLKGKIAGHYRAMGPVSMEGEKILSEVSRSSSTK